MAILRNDETALEHDAMQQSRGLERWLENKHALDITFNIFLNQESHNLQKKTRTLFFDLPIKS